MAALMIATGCTAEPSAPGHAMSPDARAYLTTALDVMEGNSLYKGDLDWPAIRRSAFTRAAKARTQAETYGAVREALRNLGDHHSQFMTPEEAKAALSPSSENSPLPEGRLLPGGIGYLVLPSVASDKAAAAYVRQARAVVRDMDRRGARGWIVDLRSNTGGDMWGPLASAGRLLNDGDIGAFVESDGKRTAWTLHEGTPKPYLDAWGPAEPLAHPDPPVAVLTSKRTASAAEAVTIAFRGQPRTRSFGRPTRGVPTANDSHRLADGAMIVLTQAREADRTGRIYDGPIPPDEELPDDARNPGNSQDGTMEAATRWLGTQ
ncbi:S41 family peptidase [Streptomyces sp. NPDC056401]|uniref:S41 family peptidase n=1 Tax=Streptomyces sp. NPDC056401 TaxID=3345809 RepID=UPI0035DBF120